MTEEQVKRNLTSELDEMESDFEKNRQIYQRKREKLEEQLLEIGREEK
ncbi:hypothetical protein ACYSNR_07350 [Enterococcus sp. LJL128]